MMLRGTHPFRLFLVAIAVIAYLFLLAPIIVVTLASFGASQFLSFPPDGFSLQWYRAALTREDFRHGLQVSLIVGIATAVLSGVIGTLSAFALIRHRFRGRELLSALFLSPLVLPSLVLALALLLMSSAVGVGPSLQRLVVAHMVICVPYVLRTLIPVLQRFDVSLEEAAQNLGAGPIATFFLVTLPVIRPALITGIFFAFIISFDEVILALFLAPPRQPTLPIEIYAAVQFSLDPTVAAVSTLLICVTLAFVVISEALFGVRRLV